jgi:Tfp pilus assembly protein PilN
MTRTNYLISPWERLFGFTPRITIPRAMRGPLVAFLCSLALIGILAGVQQARLSRAIDEMQGLTQRLAREDSAARRVDALDAEVRRLRAIDTEVERIVRSGSEDASAIAAIGNEIPAGAWLSSIRRERDGYALEGRSHRVAAVGTTLAALAALPTAGHARLISIQEAPSRHGVSYAIVLEPVR